MNRRSFLARAAGLLALGALPASAQRFVPGSLYTRPHVEIDVPHRTLTLPDQGGAYITSIWIADQCYTPVDWGRPS